MKRIAVVCVLTASLLVSSLHVSAAEAVSRCKGFAPTVQSCTGSSITTSILGWSATLVIAVAPSFQGEVTLDMYKDASNYLRFQCDIPLGAGTAVLRNCSNWWVGYIRAGDTIRVRGFVAGWLSQRVPPTGDWEVRIDYSDSTF